MGQRQTGVGGSFRSVRWAPRIHQPSEEKPQWHYHGQALFQAWEVTGEKAGLSGSHGRDLPSNPFSNLNSQRSKTFVPRGEGVAGKEWPARSVGPVWSLVLREAEGGQAGGRRPVDLCGESVNSIPAGAAGDVGSPVDL